MDISLRMAALAAALTDLDRGVRESKPNWGPRISQYLKNAGINVPAPWCAAAVQYWLDVGARAIGVANPFDDVSLPAYVQSYVDFAKRDPRVRALPEGEKPKPGDLFCLYFPRHRRYAHMGMVLYSEDSAYRTVEGNTNAAGSREGDSVLSKRRAIGPGVLFIRYGED